MQKATAYAKHVASVTGASCTLVDMESEALVFTAPCNAFCETCGNPRCNPPKTFAYGISESYRWGGQSFYYCPLGLAFTASPILDERGVVIGGLALGPFIIGEVQDTLWSLSDKGKEEAVMVLPSFLPGKVTHMAAVLTACTAFVAGIPHGKTGSYLFEQDKLLSAIYEARESREGQGGDVNLIAYEKRLRSLILDHDKQGARQLLNEMLGHIYYMSNYDLSMIKARVVELVVILSRASIDAGADSREVFLYNAAYIQQIESFKTMEDLDLWLAGMLHSFVRYSFDFMPLKHSDVVYRAMEYVRGHYAEKVTLEDVARHVYLSRSYLSSLFKEETGQSLFSYLNQVRVEKSKQLLVDKRLNLAEIAARCGFEDQSYFTKVFKKITGISPKAYRANRSAQD